MNRVPRTSPAEWTRRRERSNLLLLRLMTWLSLGLGRRVSRLALYPIVAYFLLFAPASRQASHAYLRRVLQRPPTLGDRFRHLLSFATTLHDRIFLLNDRFADFAIEVNGEEALRQAMSRKPGLLLIGAHLGSFEVMRALGRQQDKFSVSMLMYEENGRKINSVLGAINPKAVQDIIPLGHMDSMLLAWDKIDSGNLVGMLADRSLGNDPAIVHEFLGAAAAFPLGPFRMAAMLRRPVLFMTGLYLGGNRYRVHFEPLADFSAVDRKQRDALIARAQEHYVRTLERFCRQAPYNWYNFFDFWQEARPS